MVQYRLLYFALYMYMLIHCIATCLLTSGYRNFGDAYSWGEAHVYLPHVVLQNRMSSTISKQSGDTQRLRTCTHVGTYLVVIIEHLLFKSGGVRGDDNVWGR